MNRAEAKRRAEALVAQMTVEEKASQLKFDSPGLTAALGSSQAGRTRY